MLFHSSHSFRLHSIHSHSLFFSKQCASRKPRKRIPPYLAVDLSSLSPEYADFARDVYTEAIQHRIDGNTQIEEVVANRGFIKLGLVLDLGVFVGHSTRLISYLLGGQVTVHGFDTFTGIPEAWDLDGLVADPHTGMFSSESLPFHDKLFTSSQGVPHTLGMNVEFHRGMTYDTLEPFLMQHADAPVTLFHCDLDTYEGCIHGLETARKRFVVGSILIFDELFVINSELKALFEFHQKYNFKFEVTTLGHEIMQYNPNWTWIMNGTMEQAESRYRQHLVNLERMKRIPIHNTLSSQAYLLKRIVNHPPPHSFSSMALTYCKPIDIIPVLAFGETHRSVALHITHLGSLHRQ